MVRMFVQEWQKSVFESRCWHSVLFVYSASPSAIHMTSTTIPSTFSGIHIKYTIEQCLTHSFYLFICPKIGEFLATAQGGGEKKSAIKEGTEGVVKHT